MTPDEIELDYATGDVVDESSFADALAEPLCTGCGKHAVCPGEGWTLCCDCLSGR